MDIDPTPTSPNNHQPPEDIEDIPNIDDEMREHVDEAYDVIADLLYDKNFIGYDYAVHRGQIEVKDVEPRIRHSQAFQQFIREYGWPNAKDDNGIEPPHEYGTDDGPDYDAFLDAFLSRSLKQKTEDDETYEDDESQIGDLIRDYEADLNNFRFWLLTEPSSEPPSSISNDALYATHPALHRLYVVMPDLMNAVRDLVHGISEVSTDYNDFSDKMGADINKELLKAIYLIYQAAGRLLKADDKQRHRKILGLPAAKSDTKITDAHSELRA